MTDAVASNFSENPQALGGIANDNDIVAHDTAGKKDDALERQTLEQVGAQYTDESTKMQELQALAQAREQRAVSQGDGNYRYVAFGDKKGKIIIDEFTPTEARATELQTIWTQDSANTQKKGVEFSGGGASTASAIPAASAGGTSAPATPTEPADPNENLDLLKKDIPTTFKKDGTDTPYIVEKDGKLAFNDRADEPQAVEAAALQVITDAGYTKDAARAYLEDVRQKAGGDPDRMLDQINADRKQLADYSGQSSRDRSGEKPLSMYADPKSYAHHRAEGADKDDLDSFDSDYSEEGITGLSDQEEWARVMGTQGVNGGDYLDQLYGGAGGSKFTRRDIAETAGDGVYTSDRAKEVGELATQFRKEEFDRIDGEIKQQQEIIDHADSTDKQKEDAGKAIAALETEKAGVDRKIQDAIRNPREFQRLVGRDKFQASRHEKAAAAKAREETGEGLYPQVKKGFGEVKTWAGDLKSLAVDTVLGGITTIDTFTKRNDQFRTSQEQLHATARDKARTEADEKRKVRGEIFNPLNEGLAKRRDEHHTRAMEASAETGVGAGSRAGTDPEANAVADNMVASANDVEQAGPDGKKKSKRTQDKEDLADQVRAQRAIDRYTV